MSAEVGEGAVLEPVGDTLPVDGLLAHAGNHLRDVDEGTCRTTKLYFFCEIGAECKDWNRETQPPSNCDFIIVDEGFDSRLYLASAE